MRALARRFGRLSRKSPPRTRLPGPLPARRSQSRLDDDELVGLDNDYVGIDDELVGANNDNVDLRAGRARSSQIDVVIVRRYVVVAGGYEFVVAVKPLAH